MFNHDQLASDPGTAFGGVVRGWPPLGRRLLGGLKQPCTITRYKENHPLDGSCRWAPRGSLGCDPSGWTNHHMSSGKPARLFRRLYGVHYRDPPSGGATQDMERYLEPPVWKFLIIVFNPFSSLSQSLSRNPALPHSLPPSLPLSNSLSLSLSLALAKAQEAHRNQPANRRESNRTETLILYSTPPN